MVKYEYNYCIVKSSKINIFR